MLVKVEGYWINPNNVAQIYDVASRTVDCGKTHLPDCIIDFIGQREGGLFINNKTADEVATEINRQIKKGS